MTKKVLIIGLNYSGALSGRINIAVGEGMSSIAKSTDGNTWTAAGTKGGITDNGYGVSFNSELFIH